MKLLFSGVVFQGVFANLTFALSRIALGLMMAFAHGLGKLPPSEGLIGGVESMGFPLPVFFAWSAALAEFAGGILLALGLATRPSALFLSFTMFVAAFVMHAGDPFQKQEFALVYMFGFLIYLGLGSGKFGVDALLRGRG